MNEINLIHRNAYGISFHWKRNSSNDRRKVQLIFRDTGLLLTSNELLKFSSNIERTISEGKNLLCKDCQDRGKCRSLLVDSPAPQVTFAVSYEEVLELQDLVAGTLFQLNLDSLLGEIGFSDGEA